MGEIVVSVSEVMVGGVALIMSVLCVSDTDQFRAECAEKYRDCMDKKGLGLRNIVGDGDIQCVQGA